MQFSMGFFDWLFGEKVHIELPDGRTRTVTKRWFQEMERQGKARDVSNEKVRVHLLRPIAAMMHDMMSGRPIPTYQMAIWNIGGEVSKEDVEEYRDKKSGDLYAKFLLSQMAATINKRTAYTYNLSAFLASARSVLQYALEEAKTKTGGQAWYDGEVTKYNEVKFLKDKRDLTIHVEPVEPVAEINAAVTDTLHISQSIGLEIEYADGRKEQRQILDEPAAAEPEQAQVEITYAYHFPDWNGNEDVSTICTTYLNQVETIANDGITKGVITG